MKLHIERSHVERSGVQHETEFRIKTTAKAFDILSSGIYTDNIRAIVRELSCNAYDAHIAAGKEDEPFEIHLPNTMEPWFHVKDNGTGLSDEEIQGKLIPTMDEDEDGELLFSRSGGLYTTYFDSTKTDSNDFIGALGLGSKSPFSYTKSFEVMSRHGGFLRTYVVFINEDGIPTVAKMSEVPTAEQPGLEARMAVQPRDFDTFRRKVMTELKWFPVRPTVIGSLAFTFEEIGDSRIKGTNWMLLPPGAKDVSFVAVQGNVEYKINSSHFSVPTFVSSLIKRCRFVTFYQIGELEVAASREEIRYDERSKAAITSKINKFVEEIVDVIQKQKLPKKSFWNCSIELSNISYKLFGEHDALRHFLTNANVRPLLTHPMIIRYADDGGNVSYDEPETHDIWIYKQSGRMENGTTLIRNKVHNNLIAPTKQLAVFVNDVKTGGVSRLFSFIRKSAYKRGLVIRPVQNPVRRVKDADGNERFIKATLEFQQQEFKDLVKRLGTPKVHYISKDTSPVKRKATGDGSLAAYRYDSFNKHARQYGVRKISWTRLTGDTFDINDGGLYVTLKHRSNIAVNVPGHDEPILVNWSPENVKPYFNYAVYAINMAHDHRTSYNFDDIIALGIQATNKVRTLSNWSNLFKLLREAIPSHQKMLCVLANLRQTPNEFGIVTAIKNDSFASYIKTLNPKSPFRQTIEPAINDVSPIKHWESMGNFLLKFDEELGSQLFTSVGRPYYSEGAFDMYPMLRHVGAIDLTSSYRQTDLGPIFDYIKLVDNDLIANGRI